MLRALPFTVALAMSAGCGKSDGPAPPPQPELPRFAEPATHAPQAPPMASHERQRPVVDVPPRRRRKAKAAAPAPVAAVEVPAVAPEPVAEAAEEIDPKELARLEADRWLGAANLLEPGCLLTGQEPPIALPSPRALVHVLVRRPPAFSGVAREALVCKLRLRELSGAEVFGTTAFTGVARAGEINLGGGDRPQGVVVAAIHTDEPSGEGTLYLALDGRDEHHEVRAALYRPWIGDPATRRILSIRPSRLMHYRRRGMTVRQRDRITTVEHRVVLTSTERLLEVLSVPVASAPPNGPKTTARVRVHGSGYPKKISLRARVEPTSAVGGDPHTPGPTRVLLEEWHAEKDRPYVRQARFDTSLDLAGAAQALEAGRPADAEWILDKVPKAERRTPAGWRIRADAAEARRRFKSADRSWRRALKAAKDAPELIRDHAQYLLRRKRKRKAIKALVRYLELAPESPDRLLVEQQLEQLQ